MAAQDHAHRLHLPGQPPLSCAAANMQWAKSDSSVFTFLIVDEEEYSEEGLLVEGIHIHIR